MKFETVIGIEVHVELNTKTKMFCRCSADYFGKEPNTQTCPVCLGLPGGLPYINKEAIEKCIKIGLALNCSINPKSYFERKNYFYPDLAKGFQTSQLVLPIAVGGFLDVEDKDGNVTKIRINRAHQEEDTGKLTHVNGKTLIDFNRSSVPLVEIVTEPDFKDPYQVRDYAKKLQQLFRYLDVSNADMERGDMRLEANVSVRPVGQTKLPDYRVELKNINSFRFMIQAVEYEIQRQIKAHEAGEKLVQETRGYDEDKKVTYVQRSKEEAHDYRYFPEPDLPELVNEQSNIENIKNNLPELPWEKLGRYTEDFNLKVADAKILTESIELADFYEQAVEYGKENLDAIKIANYIINQKLDLIDTNPKQIVDDIKAKTANVLDDDGQLEAACKQAIDENPEMVAQFKSGKETVIQALMGVVMRKTQGKANPQKVLTILQHLLNQA